MKDFKGNEIKINDMIVFYNQTSTSGGYLREAKVIAFCNRSGYECVQCVPFNENGEEIDLYRMYPKTLSSAKIIKIND